MTEAQRDAIHRLWDSVSDFPVSQAEPALMHLMKGICEMIDAQNAYWLAMFASTQSPAIR